MLVVASVTESSQQVQDSKQWRLLFSLNLLWWSRRCIFIPRSLSLVTGESLSSPCLGERAARAQMLSRLGGGLPWCNLDRSTAQRPAAYVCLGEKQAGKLAIGNKKLWPGLPGLAWPRHRRSARRGQQYINAGTRRYQHSRMRADEIIALPKGPRNGT